MTWCMLTSLTTSFSSELFKNGNRQYELHFHHPLSIWITFPRLRMRRISSLSWWRVCQETCQRSWTLKKLSITSSNHIGNTPSEALLKTSSTTQSSKTRQSLITSGSSLLLYTSSMSNMEYSLLLAPCLTWYQQLTSTSPCRTCKPYLNKIYSYIEKARQDLEVFN